MLHFIALGVIVTASCISWFYNSKTEDEKRNQENARQEREDIYRKYQRASEVETGLASTERKQQAKQWYNRLREIVGQHEGKIAPIKEGLDELYKIIHSEILADSTSPYRKSALRREFARIEDAYMRLEQYKQYLAYERQTIEKFWNNEEYEQLLNNEAANALLPLEWLYPGKLVTVNLNEIGKKLPVFGHKLLFDGSMALQQTHAIAYGDEFPLLVTRPAKEIGTFWGCVARGIIYSDHIIPVNPVEMTIERYLSKDRAYQGLIFDGLVRANLPELKVQHSHLRCIPGQKIQVYLENYDLTLTKDPSVTKGSPITVTTTEPSRMGSLGGYQIYMVVDEALLRPVSDERFYSSESQWTLLDFNMESAELTLGKASVQIICSPVKTGEGLEVTKLYQTGLPQLGVDLPFELILVSQDLEPESIFAWKYGVEQLFQFATQATLNKQVSEQRAKQARFFRRWRAILDYQKKHESQRSVEFEGTLIPILTGRDSFKLIVPYSAYAHLDDVTDLDISNLFKIIQKSNGNLKPEYCCQLQRWGYDKQAYLPALDIKKSTPSFRLSETGDFEIEGRFYIKTESVIESHKFKFKITLPNAPLQRQQQALDALFEDRLIEPKLKDILLSPSSYQPENKNYWENHEIQWQSNLTKNQKEVVKTSLKTKYIALIQGPPGTGKTTAIVEMLYQLLSQNPNQRILVVSQQNTAVDNAISRFKEKNAKLVESSVNIVRIGNPDKIDEGLTQYQFDSLFDDFLTQTIGRVNQTAHTLPEHLQNLSYQWASVLRQMKCSQDSKSVSDEFFSTMLTDKNLIGATCVGLAARKAGVDYLDFDIAIIDEAGRATVPELLIPLLRCRKVILIGDHFQLPPSIAPILREDTTKEILPFIQEEFLEKSFFELLFEELPKSCTTILKEQFRMPSKIGDLIADLFYTKNGERQLFNGRDDHELILPEPIYWVDIFGKQEKPKHSTSLENIDEAEAICSFLRKLEKCNQSIDTVIDVAIITPYGAQKRKIRQLLSSNTTNNEQTIALGNLRIKIDTVDGFQGSEADIVCYSTVRTQGSLQFLLDRKRLNVACSRAKKNIIFFGYSKYLKQWKPSENETNLFHKIIVQSKVINLEKLLASIKPINGLA